MQFKFDLDDGPVLLNAENEDFSDEPTRKFDEVSLLRDEKSTASIENKDVKKEYVNENSFHDRHQRVYMNRATM